MKRLLRFIKSILIDMYNMFLIGLKLFLVSSFFIVVFIGVMLFNLVAKYIPHKWKLSKGVKEIINDKII